MCSAPSPTSQPPRFQTKNRPARTQSGKTVDKKRYGLVHICATSVSHVCVFFAAGAFEKKAPSQSHNFNLVKYTKTLSVRNRHERYSPAFFHAKRASTRPRADSMPSPRAASIASRTASPSRPPHRSPIEAHRLENAPTFIRASSKSGSAAAHRAPDKFENRAPHRAAAHTVFKFVAIMRHAHALGKRITATAAAMPRAAQRAHTNFDGPMARGGLRGAATAGGGAMRR
ncbi:hypothetical protein [Rugamonas sp.]|uniref:hypothetical protein n=1 Tax=Rugamonas sp. TaxID=1926287 RepID=UPI0025D10799|nr:hypothetical protein [Rugamonas sp.]